ncbi:MAG: hypothetical protein ACO24G_08750 [Burkholderiaceae bacterium]
MSSAQALRQISGPMPAGSPMVIPIECLVLEGVWGMAMVAGAVWMITEAVQRRG